MLFIRLKLSNTHIVLKRTALFQLLIYILFAFGVCNTTEPSLRISFTGDVIMHQKVQRLALSKKLSLQKNNNTGKQNCFNYLFEDMREYFLSSNAVFCNMEFPVIAPYKTNGFVFNCDPAVIDALKYSGITHFSIANNHIMDHDLAGLKSTIDHLEKAKVHYSGAGLTKSGKGRLVLLDLHNIRAGILSYTALMNYEFPDADDVFINSLNNIDQVKTDIIKLKKNCDYLIMIAHFGNEYSIKPDPKYEKLMKELCDTGIDLVIGHHPHVLNKLEKYITKDGREAYIFYSLGNFISSQKRKVVSEKKSITLKESAVITVILKKENNHIKSRFEILPVTTINTDTEIKVMPLEKLINNLYSNLETLKPDEKKNILKEIKSSQKKSSDIKAVLLDGKEYSDILFLTPIESFDKQIPR